MPWLDQCCLVLAPLDREGSIPAKFCVLIKGTPTAIALAQAGKCLQRHQ
jgi:hypothetical protein